MKSNAIAFLHGADTARPSTPVGSLISTVKRYFSERAALRRLQALDDHMLADIGLSRGMVGIEVIRNGQRD